MKANKKPVANVSNNKRQNRQQKPNTPSVQWKTP